MATFNNVYDILVGVGYLLRDTIEGSVTAAGAGASFFKDSKRLGDDDDWNGSEVIFRDITGMTGVNPFLVLDFTGATGEFSLNQAYGAATPANNTRYCIMNARGQGYPYAVRYEALKQVMQEIQWAYPAFENVITLNATNCVYGYVHDLTSSGLASIYEVAVRDPVTKREEIILRRDRRIDEIGVKLAVWRTLRSGWELVQRGRLRPSIAAAADGTIGTIPNFIGFTRQDLIAATTELCQLTAQQRIAMAQAGSLYTQRMRGERRGRRADEVFFV
jgi:hypothetical protein